MTTRTTLFVVDTPDIPTDQLRDLAMFAGVECEVVPDIAAVFEAGGPLVRGCIVAAYDEDCHAPAGLERVMSGGLSAVLLQPHGAPPAPPSINVDRSTAVFPKAAPFEILSRAVLGRLEPRSGRPSSTPRPVLSPGPQLHPALL